MKICWDTLDRISLSKEGNFKVGENIYVEMPACKVCGESYLTLKAKPGLFCGGSCATSGKNNPMYGIKMFGSLKHGYKGVCKYGITIYDTYKDRLGIYEDIRKQDNTEVLEAKCAYCGRWYTPKYITVKNRLDSINHLNKGECRLYCSDNCKQACPTFGKKMYPKGFKKGTSREVSTYLRQMVFERDNWECQKCGKTINDTALHCHHIKGYAQNKILANDADNCITLCKDCHKEIHKQKGCRYVDLQCK